MTIRILLITAIILLLVYFFKNSQKVTVRAWKKIALILLLVFAVFSVLFPDIFNGVALFVGIGRGADLLLYTITIAFIFVTLNIYIKFKDISLKQDRIVSKIALLEEEIKNGK